MYVEVPSLLIITLSVSFLNEVLTIHVPLNFPSFSNLIIFSSFIFSKISFHPLENIISDSNTSKSYFAPNLFAVFNCAFNILFVISFAYCLISDFFSNSFKTYSLFSTNSFLVSYSSFIFTYILSPAYSSNFMSFSGISLNPAYFKPTITSATCNPESSM